jgi:hypothetical protein
MNHKWIKHTNLNNILKLQFSLGGRDSAVDIATGYVLESPGPNSSGGEMLCAVRNGPRAPNILYDGYGIFCRGKAAEVWY